MLIYTKGEIYCGSRSRDLLSFGFQQAIGMSGVKITRCPTCGSKRIRRVRRDVTIDVGDIHFVAPDVVFEECPNSGEQLFDLAAMEQIQAHRPPTARAKVRRRKIA